MKQKNSSKFAIKLLLFSKLLDDAKWDKPEKNKSHVISLICGVWKQTNRPMDTETKNDGLQRGEGKGEKQRNN